MSGTILENLSGKKLTILVSFLMFCQLICFLIGGLIGEMKILLFAFSFVYISLPALLFIASARPIFGSDDSRNNLQR